MNIKELYRKLRAEYRFYLPLIFEDLSGRGCGGYVSFSKCQKIPRKIVLDNSGRFCFGQNYCLCHEVAHVVLALSEKETGHTKAHSDLTYKIALKYNLV